MSPAKVCLAFSVTSLPPWSPPPPGMKAQALVGCLHAHGSPQSRASPWLEKETGRKVLGRRSDEEPHPWALATQGGDTLR